MNNIRLVLLLSVLLPAAGHSYAQDRKIDTTVKFDKVGYRVTCSNKKADENMLSISPVGFKSEARPATFAIKGKVTQAAVEDLNEDGYPDLLIYVFSGAHNEIGNVIAITSTENKSLAPVYFPDIYEDPKLREGYKGHDEFSTFSGTVVRSFPIYKTGDAPDKPTGGKRVAQYKAMMVDGALRFKVIRTFDKQPES